MGESVLLGRGRQLLRLPREMWEQHLAQVPEHSGDRLRFMTEDSHRVRYFVVKELPLTGKPIAPEEISAALQMPLARVEAILEELERQLFFLVRNEQLLLHELVVQARAHKVVVVILVGGVYLPVARSLAHEDQAAGIPKGAPDGAVTRCHPIPLCSSRTILRRSR